MAKTKTKETEVNAVKTEVKEEVIIQFDESQVTPPQSIQERVEQAVDSYDEIITFAEAGRQIGKSRQTISRWVSDGLIPVVRLPSGLYGIRQSTFDQLHKVSLTMKEIEANIVAAMRDNDSGQKS